MKARGRVRGILIEGSDGHEYLLGFEPTAETSAPVLSRRRADGTFEPLRDAKEASKIALAQTGVSRPRLIGPGMGKDFFLWFAFQEALKRFPPVPTWPNWPA
jgi:hypothetical protein